MKKEVPFVPDIIVNSILDVTPELLKSYGIKGVLCDTDNTLAFDNKKDIIPEAEKWVKMMNEAGIKVCIMSNSFLIRNWCVIKALSIKYWHTRSHKPHSRNYYRMPQKMGLKKEEVCMLGDQMRTDIAGANNADMLSVYVMPYAFETNVFYKFHFVRCRAKERQYFKIYNELHATRFDYPQKIKDHMREEDLKECVY
jgi:HAD superfamily phosphatase (TIGR01668 family)